MSVYNRKLSLATLDANKEVKAYSTLFNSFLEIYQKLNCLALYVFTLVLFLVTYEIVPFNEEFIAVMCIFFAFVTIDQLASQVIRAVFQEEQQVLFLSIIKKSYEAFSLCLFQKNVEKKSFLLRRKKKLFVYSFLHDLLFYLNYFDFVLVHFFDTEEVSDYSF